MINKLFVKKIISVLIDIFFIYLVLAALGSLVLFIAEFGFYVSRNYPALNSFLIAMFGYGFWIFLPLYFAFIRKKFSVGKRIMNL